MATKILILLSLFCSLLAGCAGRADDAPTSSATPGGPASCFALCSSCGQPHYVWTCPGTPPAAPSSCAWVQGYAGPVIRCASELADPPAGCALSDLTPSGSFDYTCSGASS